MTITPRAKLVSSLLSEVVDHPGNAGHHIQWPSRLITPAVSSARVYSASKYSFFQVPYRTLGLVYSVLLSADLLRRNFSVLESGITGGDLLLSAA